MGGSETDALWDTVRARSFVDRPTQQATQGLSMAPSVVRGARLADGSTYLPTLPYPQGESSTTIWLPGTHEHFPIKPVMVDRRR